MFLSINKCSSLSLKTIKTLKIMKAKRFIFRCNFGATEVLLNNYLLKTEKKSLKNICILIINNLKISKNIDGEIIITFITPEINRLAELITYGNLEIGGSNILKAALKERI